jgi:WhiB family redox-sensing transcriptional regulator
MFNVHNTEWMERGACTSVWPELFFPLSPNDKDQINLARQVCQECPVLNECYIYAMNVNVYGIWAGTTSEQRKLSRGKIKLVPIQIEETYRHLKQTERKPNATPNNHER